MDTQKSVEELESAGIDSGQAKAIVRVVKTTLDEYPSFDRLERMHVGIRAEIAELRGEMRVDFTTFREEMRQEFAEFRSQMRAEFAEFRSQMQKESAEFHGQMREEFAKFREGMRDEFAKFRFQMIWLVVLGNAATIISLLVAIFLKH